MTRWLLSRLTQRTSSVRPTAVKLALTSLEERAVPATIQVTNTNNAGAGSFRDALTQVNTSADATNTVTFLPGLFGTITLASDLPTIAKPVTVQGPGANLISVSGAAAFKIFTIDDGLAGSINVTIDGLKITGGKNSTTGGGGVFSENENVTVRNAAILNNAGAGVQGGGIRANGGSFTLLNTRVANNVAPDGAGIRNAGAAFIITDSQIENNNATNGNGTGGYYQSSGALQDMTNSSVTGNQGGLGAGMFVTGGPSTIVNSLIANNRATNAAGSDGGGLAVAGGDVTLKNVTVSGNVANDEGGGIHYTTGTGSLTIRNSTIAFNTSDNDNSGASAGGGLFATATNNAKVFSTIIAKNQRRSDGAATQSDVSATLDGTSANNLIGVNTDLAGITNGTQGNQVGTAGTPRDPLLNVLAFNGGLTQTHAIQATSPAKDLGDDTGLGLTNDGRGAPFLRVVGTKADIGAFEIQSAAITLQVTTAADENDAVFNAASLSLREAIRLAGTDASVITFAPALNGQTITFTQGRVTIDRAVDIQGPGAKQLTISGNNQFQIFSIDNGTTATAIDVKLSGLTLTGSKADTATGGNSDGGAIVTSENVTLDGLVITGNEADDDGGGVDQQFGTLTILNSTISNNKANGAAGVGGGVSLTAGTGTIVIRNSTISGNTAGNHGGGVAMDVAGNIVIQNSTISGNQAKANGGGVRIVNGTLDIRNSTIAFNKAESDGAGAGKGGGISIDGGTAKMVGTIVAKNDVGTTGSNLDINGKVDGTFSLVSNTTGWDQSGSSNNKLAVDPNLGALQNNGGPTFTHALPATGPATDPGFTDAQINPDNLTTDQRGAGFPRKVGASIDIGAFEFNPNTAPTISDITDKTTTTGVAVGPVTFTIGDAETAAGSLTLAGTSSNTTLVPNANIVFGGSGASRTVTITPAAGQNGTATITITVTDAGGLTATDTFVVTVNAGPPNTPPTISDITNRTTTTGVAVGPIAFTVADAETPVANLNLAGSSSNTTLVPTANIVFGGSGANRTVTVTPAAGQTGTATITVTVTDANGATATDTFTVTVNAAAAASPILVGGAPNGTATVFNPSGGKFAAGANQTFFAGATGNVRTATADVNGDGTADFIGGTGPGKATSVVVLDGKTGATIATISPFEAAFTGGVFIAAADINADGKADIIVTPDQGGGPVAAIYSGAKLSAGQTNDAAQIIRYLGIDDASFRGGARATAGDITGDGVPEVIVSAGFLGGPRITIWNGTSVVAGTPTQLLNFFAFEDTVRNGAFVAAGDMNGDGRADIAFGGGPNGAPRVRVFDGAALLNAGLFANLDQVGTGQVGNFFAGDSSLRGGVRLAFGNVDGDGKADLITGSGEGETSRVRVYLGPTILANSASPSTAQEFDPFGASLANGVFVG